MYLSSKKEMQEQINKTDGELKTAYKEMLSGAIANLNEKEFYAIRYRFFETY